MDFSEAILEGARVRSTESSGDVASVIDFVESRVYGLGVDLYPVQRVILKAHYGNALEERDESVDPGVLQELPYDELYDLALQKRPNLEDQLDKEELANIVHGTPISLRNWRGEHKGWFSELEYIQWLNQDGRCNIDHVVEGDERHDIILAIGRRSGKTLMASCIVAYETYKIIKKSDPHKYYGIAQSNPIQLVSVATDKDQAGLLFSEVNTHFGNCEYFTPYQANSTETYAKFQTPTDQEKFGLYSENKHARRSIKVTFRPCVAKGLRGAGNLVVILDEVAHFVDNSNQQSADAICTAVEPSLAAFSPKHPRNKKKPLGPSEGRLVLISSPLGKDGLFYERFQRAVDTAADGVFAMRAPTWEVNPSIDSQYFQRKYAQDSRKFYQEFGADFTDKTKAWIEDPQDLYDCIDKDLRPKTQGIPRQSYFMGIDVALKGDATAIAIGHFDPAEQRIVLDYIEEMQAGCGDWEFDKEGNRLERLDFGEILDWIVDLSRKFHIVEGLFDQEQGYALEYLLKRKGLKQIRMERMTDSLNSDIYSSFKSLMYDRRVKLFDRPGTRPHQEHADYLEQFKELQAEYKSKNKVKVFAPKRAGSHDDMADAITRMVWLASQRMGKQNTITNVKRGVFANTGVVRQAGSGSRHRFRQYAMEGASHPSRMPARSRARGRGRRRIRRRTW